MAFGAITSVFEIGILNMSDTVHATPSQRSKCRASELVPSQKRREKAFGVGKKTRKRRVVNEMANGPE